MNLCGEKFEDPLGRLGIGPEKRGQKRGGSREDAGREIGRYALGTIKILGNTPDAPSPTVNHKGRYVSR
jgi:hypothetical protein